MNTSDKTEGLRERKKRATRKHISDTATVLFIAHGFERVTIADVAAAADVSKMTVFNYFSRKEELFFDRGDDVCQLLRNALDCRGHLSPVAALRALALELVRQEHPLIRMNRDVAGYWELVAGSTSLHAYALEQFEQLEQTLGDMLTTSVDAPANDPIARLIAAIVLNTWRIAFREALRQQQSISVATARKTFLALIERGFVAVEVVAKGTPYA